MIYSQRFAAPRFIFHIGKVALMYNRKIILYPILLLGNLGGNIRGEYQRGISEGNIRGKN